MAIFIMSPAIPSVNSINLEKWYVFIAERFIDGGGNAKGNYNIIAVLCESYDNALSEIEEYDSSILGKDLFRFSSGHSVYEAFRNHPGIKQIEQKSKYGTTWAERISEDIANNKPGPATLVLRNDTDQQSINRVTMPDGTDGLLCIKCEEYYPYVEPNSPEGYICPKHK